MQSDSMKNSIPGRPVIILGAMIVVVGILMLYGSKIPFLGKLPGDIHLQKETFAFYFPITTCVVLSILLYFIMRLFQK